MQKMNPGSDKLINELRPDMCDTSNATIHVFLFHLRFFWSVVELLAVCGRWTNLIGITQCECRQRLLSRLCDLERVGGLDKIS